MHQGCQRLVQDILAYSTTSPVAKKRHRLLKGADLGAQTAAMLRGPRLNSMHISAVQGSLSERDAPGQVTYITR